MKLLWSLSIHRLTSTCGEMGGGGLPSCVEMGGGGLRPCGEMGGGGLRPCVEMGGGGLRPCVEMGGGGLRPCVEMGGGGLPPCGEMGGGGLRPCGEMGGGGLRPCVEMGGGGLPPCVEMGGGGLRPCGEMGGGGLRPCVEMGGGGLRPCGEMGGGGLRPCGEMGGGGLRPCVEMGGGGLPPCVEMGGGGLRPCGEMGGGGLRPCGEMGGGGLRPCGEMGGGGLPPCVEMGGGGLRPCVEMGGGGLRSCGEMGGGGLRPCGEMGGGGLRPYNGLSFVYLVYLLLIPLFAEPTSTTMQGHTGRLLQSLCFTSMTFVLFHIIYQITVNSLLATHSIKAAEINCSMWEKSIRQIGFESVIGADAGNGIRVFLPDIGMFLTGLAVWLVCRSLVQRRPPEDMAQDNAHFQSEELEEEEKLSLEDRGERGVQSEGDHRKSDHHGRKGGGHHLAGPYSCMCVLMAIFSAGHLSVLYLYQFQFFQEAIHPNDTIARADVVVRGLHHRRPKGRISSLPERGRGGFETSVHVSDCACTWKLIMNADLHWNHFVNPVMLLLLYYTLATLIRLWLQEPIEQLELLPTQDFSTSEGPNETSFEFTTTDNGPVSVDLYSTPHYKMDQSTTLDPDLSEKKRECVYEVSLPSDLEGEKKGEGEDGAGPPSAVVTVFRFVMKQSYICALIAMMAWSITYVSWLTFVFLLWSCLLWMVRDRRRYAMLTSPFMVMYGNLLITLQYIFSFETLNTVPGFFIHKEVSFSELGSKTEEILCLLSFWLLLRQTLMERQDKLSRQDTALSDVVVDQDKAKGQQLHDL
ncbi:hypothetical protein NHX12_003907 [Muraenolepis orangiensis]|uniref:Piezo TM1-24 domain-containing protein n=1 Tax=Muraenolepis orangiensis TaxID=630683 RepID=A0A9Q0DTG6_9TELE|nr:hypothetical protein NHX12_003907 [Muraenolepis orangiensis]